MKVDVKWEELDQETEENQRSFAKISEVKVGNKKFQSPNRGIKIAKTTSEFELWNKITGDILPPKGFAFMHKRILPSTMDNITKTNGKFNQKVNEISSRFNQIIDSKSLVKVAYPRIPKSKKDEIKLSEASIRASLDLLNLSAGNEMNVLPLPPYRGKEIRDNFNLINNAIEDVYSTSRIKKPLAGYIPPVENPNIAGDLAEKYLTIDETDVKIFVADFSAGKKTRNALEIARRLKSIHDKGDIDDFYIHGINVPKNWSTRNDPTIFYDLPMTISGLDSFNNRLFGGGSSDVEDTVREENEKKKYSLSSQYGSFSFEKLKKYGLLDEKCDCPACRNQKIDEIYDTPDHSLFIDRLRVHRIYQELVETEEYRRVLNEQNSVLDHIREKPLMKEKGNKLFAEIMSKSFDEFR